MATDSCVFVSLNYLVHNRLKAYGLKKIVVVFLALVMELLVGVVGLHCSSLDAVFLYFIVA